MIEGAPGHGEGHNSGQARQHHRGDRGEEDHGAREAARHDPHLAGHRRGAGRHQGLLRARRASSRTSTSRSSPTSDNDLARVVGRSRRHRPGLGRVHVHGADRAFGRRAVARPQRARRRRADEHRLELPPRAPAARAPLALRRHQRRRSAERRAAQGLGLVLLPPDDVSEDQGAVGHRRLDRQGRGDDDRTPSSQPHARARQRLAAALQQGRRRNRRGPTSRRSACRTGARPTRRSPRRCRRSSEPRAGAAAEGRRRAAGAGARQPRRRLRRHRRHLVERADGHAALPVEHSRACPGTTGPTRSRWRRRSRTRAPPPAPRCRR